MPSRFLILAGLFATGLFSGLLAAPTASESALVFNATLPKNDLKGSFAAQVLFAQSQVIPSHPREDDRQPRLISLRKTLVMVRPVRVDSAPIAFNDPVVLTAIDVAGKELGTLTLNPPQQLPKTAYFVDGTPVKGIDFTPPAGKVGVIADPATVAKLAEMNGAAVLQQLRGNALVRIETADGRWAATSICLRPKASRVRWSGSKPGRATVRRSIMEPAPSASVAVRA